MALLGQSPCPATDLLELSPIGGRLPALQRLTQAKREIGPLTGTMTHKLNFFPPPAMLEEKNNLTIFFLYLENDMRIKPFLGPATHFHATGC